MPRYSYGGTRVPIRACHEGKRIAIVANLIVWATAFVSRIQYQPHSAGWATDVTTDIFAGCVVNP